VSTPQLFALLGVALFALGLHALFVRAHLFWKILAFNIMGSGAFLVLSAASPTPADPVPQALVLTGIVVTVAATALALALALRVVVRTGRAVLPEDDRRGAAIAANRSAPATSVPADSAASPERGGP
jgi:multicomponent Na+:H+ antiporter subunit C